MCWFPVVHMFKYTAVVKRCVARLGVYTLLRGKVNKPNNLKNGPFESDVHGNKTWIKHKIKNQEVLASHLLPTCNSQVSRVCMGGLDRWDDEMMR